MRPPLSSLSKRNRSASTSLSVLTRASLKRLWRSRRQIPFQTAPPFEQPFRLGASDGWNLAHFFNHVGGGLNAVRKQSRFMGEMTPLISASSILN